ncbi:MAG: membrane associated rhomboid family serine protease [Lentisphaeria bacterium]|jgi:membrane associated rhomboid family serine protease
MHNVTNIVRMVAYVSVSLLAVHIVNMVLDGNLNRFGIYPRDVHTLYSIVLAPWLHGSWAHLLNNLVGISIFSGLCMLLRGVRFYWQSSMFIILMTGALVWLFGRPAVHIGASGWIFGLWSLSIALAWFQRSFLNVCVAIFVALFYGSMIFGVLPSNGMISFESHLFGAISGVVCAYVMTRKSARKRVRIRR